MISHNTDLKIKPGFKHLLTLSHEESAEELQDVFKSFETLFQNVMGITWRKYKASHLISDFINVTQEETALWILKNYEDKWNSEGELKHSKYTGRIRGNMTYKGWSSERIHAYNDLFQLVKGIRVDRRSFEEEFQTH